MDLWLRDECGLFRQVSIPKDDARKAPTVPNRFLALVPSDVAAELAAQCEASARAAWKQMASEVHDVTDAGFRSLSGDDDWDRRWSSQIEDFFDVRTAILPLEGWNEAQIVNLYGANTFEKISRNAVRVRELLEGDSGEIPPGQWQVQVELSSRIMDARRQVRHVPHYEAKIDNTEQYPPKCSLLGTYEQMGPDGLNDSRKFWEEAAKKVTYEGVRLRSQEQFSAIALAKRFAGPAHFAEKLHLIPAHKKLRFPDTATIAAAEWLESNGIEYEKFERWSGQWLHWSKKDQDKDDPVPDDVWKAIVDARKRSDDQPSVYYAVLQLDGDHMGRWLAGEKTPALKEIYHPEVVRYFSEHDKCDLLEARRPVTPEYHAAISEALTNFAVRVVTDIVQKHNGVLIYAGGDDVLALLPTRNAIQCATELHDAFSSDYLTENGDKILLMGSKATVSAGIAVVHYKEDLRIALKAARRAESEAKNAGRDLLRIATLRRSGEHASTTCPWDMTKDADEWIGAFTRDASDRWAYHLRAELPTLQYLEPDAVEAMIRRRIKRSNEPTQKAFEGIEERYRDYAMKIEKKASSTQKKLSRENDSPLEQSALEGFLTLIQTASFMARGRDA